MWKINIKFLLACLLCSVQDFYLGELENVVLFPEMGDGIWKFVGFYWTFLISGEGMGMGHYWIFEGRDPESSTSCNAPSEEHWIKVTQAVPG